EAIFLGGAADKANWRVIKAKAMKANRVQVIEEGWILRRRTLSGFQLTAPLEGRWRSACVVFALPLLKPRPIVERSEPLRVRRYPETSQERTISTCAKARKNRMIWIIGQDLNLQKKLPGF